MMARVFDIQRFSVNDGPGIRTNIFLKGCPLRCVWCHNPESQLAADQLLYDPSRCTACADCVSVCPSSAHVITADGLHALDRQKCVECGLCAEACQFSALEIVGKDMTAEQIIDKVSRDKPFYDNSGGGMTLTGGEPLMYPELCAELCDMAKARGIDTCIETCGYAHWESIEPLLHRVRLFLYDIKETDPVRHKQYTGVDNSLILDNLRRLSASGAEIVLRCPIIPDLNDREEHFRAIAALAEELSGVIRIDVEPYHPLGKGKNERLGREYPLSDLTSPDDDRVKGWIDQIAVHTRKTVKKG